MISKFYITGDCHGKMDRFHSFQKLVPSNEIWGVICLGDFGVNFWLNKTDIKLKKYLKNNFPNLYFYCVRGNHEERPENLEYIEHHYDENVKGYVMMEPEFPNIRYFEDGDSYEICGHSVLVIGGAYSVDKWHRLARAQANGDSFSGWFEDEQLTVWEMIDIESSVVGKKYDFVFTHTGPIDWEPTDLFLSFIDQSQVDKTMENWLNEIKDTFTWGVWCFGHFHDDRIERPHVEQFFYDIENLEEVWNRWTRYDKTGELDLHLRLSPAFEKEMLYKELVGNEEKND